MRKWYGWAGALTDAERQQMRRLIRRIAFLKAKLAKLQRRGRARIWYDENVSVNPQGLKRKLSHHNHILK